MMRARPYFQASSAIKPTALLALVAGLVATPLACGGSDGSANDGASPDAGAAEGSAIDAPTTPPGDGGGPPLDAPNTNDAPAANDAPADGPSLGCPRAPAAADRPRRVVVSHPFAVDGGKATLFEVLSLSQAGTLTRPAAPVTFQMGTALDAPIVFTPDGEIGLVSQDDGSIGVFKLPATGAPTVIHAAFAGNFYAGGLVLTPDGSTVYVLDSNVRKNGGGVYRIPIHCDGTLGTATLVVPGSGASAMALLPGDPTKAVLGATAAFDSAVNQDVHLVDLAAQTRIASASVFLDGMASVASLAVAPDGKFAILADNSFSAGSRIAAVAITPSFVPAGGILATPFPDGVAVSPYDDSAIVLNDDSTDQIHVLTYDPANAAAPFAIKGELVYKFGKPQIPISISLIDRGALKGTTFVGENIAVRQLTFGAGGAVTDTAKLVFPGGGNETIIGVVGVQP